ncbi:MAG: DUF2889 domain-containing protein [Pseudomonadota bacterium]
MSLSQPVGRKLAHTRTVQCHGYERDDGLWDIEGRMIDTKPYRFTNRDRGGWIEADEALHDMSIRLTVSHDLEVKDVEAIIDYSPYHYCKSVVSVAKNLIGLKIAPGWTRKSKAAMGANRGCTHLTELLGPIATTAIQTILSGRREERIEQKDETPEGLLDSCHSYASYSPVVRDHWPDFYQPGK